jgi:hypothetical protein
MLPLPPAQTLQAARERLLTIFTRQFEAASTARDSANTSRVFKLFPEVGWENEGLELYARFVVDLIRARAPAGVKSTKPVFISACLILTISQHRLRCIILQWSLLYSRVLQSLWTNTSPLWISTTAKARCCVSLKD